MADGDALGEVNLHAGGLLFHATGQVNQAVIHKTIRRIIITLRAGREVNVFELVRLIVIKQYTP